MTPLAYHISKELTLPTKRRLFGDPAGIQQRMDDLHCFELSGVEWLMNELAPHIAAGTVDERTSFLPAPRTWIELRSGGSRLAWHLEESGDDRVVAKVSSAFQGGDRFGSVAGGYLRLGMGSTEQGRYNEVIKGDKSSAFILAALAIINTPRIIGRVTHQPHKGFERRLLAMRGAIGKFPLHAWTEVKLKVTDPAVSSDEVDAHYTGERALHFCRAHLRVRMGRLEIVRSHWRGDASLGIKQSRYVVTA